MEKDKSEVLLKDTIAQIEKQYGKESLFIPASDYVIEEAYIKALEESKVEQNNDADFQEMYKKTLWKHKPITDFWQISKGTQKRLEKFGIFDMESLAHFDEKLLYDEFGINAELLIDHAWGRESCLMKDIKNV